LLFISTICKSSSGAHGGGLPEAAAACIVSVSLPFALHHCTVQSGQLLICEEWCNVVKQAEHARRTVFVNNGDGADETIPVFTSLPFGSL